MVRDYCRYSICSISGCFRTVLIVAGWTRIERAFFRILHSPTHSYGEVGHERWNHVEGGSSAAVRIPIVVDLPDVPVNDQLS